MTAKIESEPAAEAGSVFDPQSWGLPPEVIEDLASRLRQLWAEFRPGFTTQTRDTSEYAYLYLRGLLTMDTKRNYANIARRVISPTDDGQNLQQFMSDSPWEAKAVFYQIQSHIASHPELGCGMLTLDESGFERAGDQSAGAERQYIGRLGKVELGQVAVALGYCEADTWSMVDAELFLPQNWFTKRYAQLRKRWHIPTDRTFATKAEIGLEMIKQAQRNGLPFEIVGCDSFYGRDHTFRANLNALRILYIADVPKDTMVYLQKPILGIPKRTGKRGRPATRKQVINEVSPISVHTLAEEMEFDSVEVRATERGRLTSTCAAISVWTVTESAGVQKEWLLARQEPDESESFSMSNAEDTTELKQLAFWRSQRYFAERTFQDAKTEAGWDQLVARKYRAFIHHTALDALALWFATETKLHWAQSYPRSEALASQLEIEKLPALSMANIRELLKAVLPLEQLTPQQAIELVVRHLVNRSNSTRSRQKAEPKNPP